LNMQPHS